MAKILLVEDDSNLREIYGTRLEAEGYQIVSASDGEEALATAVREKPDLIISDVMMPKISGFDMLDILRTTPETKDVKVIVMTALSQEEDRKRGEQLGADRYVVKSQVTLDDVVTMVSDLLGTTPAATPSSQPTLTSDQAAIALNPQSSTAAVSDSGEQSSTSTPTPPPSSASDNQQASVATDATAASNDTGSLDNEVASFVASSPLMNGVPPQPQTPSEPQQPIAGPPDIDTTNEPATSQTPPPQA